MNEIVNKFLLVENRFMPEMHSKKNLVLITALVVCLLKTKKEFKNLCRQQTQAIFTKMISIKLVFNMIWLNGKYKDLAKIIEPAKI